MTATKIKLDKKLLKALDNILCYGFHGSEFNKYGDSFLEVSITEDDAKILQEFHRIVNACDKDKAQCQDKSPTEEAE